MADFGRQQTLNNIAMRHLDARFSLSGFSMRPSACILNDVALRLDIRIYVIHIHDNNALRGPYHTHVGYHTRIVNETPRPLFSMREAMFKATSHGLVLCMLKYV